MKIFVVRVVVGDLELVVLEVKFLERLKSVQALNLAIADACFTEIQHLQSLEAESARERDIRNAVAELLAAPQTQHFELITLGQRHQIVGRKKVAILESHLLEIRHVLEDVREGFGGASAVLGQDAVGEDQRAQICREFCDSEVSCPVEPNSIKMEVLDEGRTQHYALDDLLECLAVLKRSLLHLLLLGIALNFKYSRCHCQILQSLENFPYVEILRFKHCLRP